jgi:glycine/sarcosine N-methyltransferase
MSSNTHLNPAVFYDLLSAEYDSMTDYEKRFVKDQDTFKAFIERFDIVSAVDAGTGTGFHALLLARLGVDVTAVDISGEMLRKCEENATTLGVRVKTLQSDFAHIPALVTQSFDAVLCLGNSLAHILTNEALSDSLAAFRKILKKDGILILQILNYDKILRERHRVQQIRRAGSKTFIRFYDYCGDRLFFNILSVHEDSPTPAHTIQTVELHPYTADELKPFLRNAGFGEIRIYGDLRFTEYSGDYSRDIVIIARSNS